MQIVNIMYLSILFMPAIKPGDGKMDSGANTFYLFSVFPVSLTILRHNPDSTTNVSRP